MPEYHSNHGTWHAGPRRETCVKCGYVPPVAVTKKTSVKVAEDKPKNTKKTNKTKEKVVA